jgi:hypothetical protein
MEGRVIAVVLRVDVASLVDEPVRHVCVEGEVGNYCLHGKLLFTIINDVASLVDEPVRHVCVPLEEGEVGNYYLHIKLLVTIIIYRIIYHCYLPVCPSRKAR